MLLKSPERDARELAFAEWRAKLPFWNIEADRFRAAALEARRTGTVPAGLSDDIDEVQDQIREALQDCDALLEAALPGDQQLAALLNATGEFEALLESLHVSRERIDDLGGSAPRARPLVAIGRGSAERPPALR
ncbi:MAG TPA: hypothetical protein VGN80_09510 [Devosiaceae bacterium]|jgi:hypothetical protein|nr:hypothetical protein [Devosiaceae bacterium]